MRRAWSVGVIPRSVATRDLHLRSFKVQIPRFAWNDSDAQRSTLHAMKITHDLHTRHTKHPFVIARGGSREWKLVRVRIVERDGVGGRGGAAQSRFYSEATEGAITALAKSGPDAERRL